MGATGGKMNNTRIMGLRWTILLGARTDGVEPEWINQCTAIEEYRRIAEST